MQRCCFWRWRSVFELCRGLRNIRGCVSLRRVSFLDLLLAVLKQNPKRERRWGTWPLAKTKTPRECEGIIDDPGWDDGLDTIETSKTVEQSRKDSNIFKKQAVPY
uniref:uncharacterized protein LOC105351533 n=1 Tax=Fragaria vesca subsp. vesca TaxID=101020 RepID=UPI0005C81B81|nr:PREDICTED: uncharacterized protein LOC105351533 [Fragaria vesca subsp. vesca]